jgi:A/G-specific adenine glycosylase
MNHTDINHNGLAQDAFQAFQNHIFLVVNKGGMRAAGRNFQDGFQFFAVFGRSLGLAHLHAHGIGLLGQVFAHDFGPIIKDAPERDKLAGEGLASDLADRTGEMRKAHKLDNTAKRGKDQAPTGARLAAWYTGAHRILPWRAKPGQGNDPYHVWLSEIMLQQTTVPTVIAYYQKFLSRWPSVHDLAAAPVEQVLKEWAGLGYYARARNLHKCARAVAASGGVFPQTVEGLMCLPGIGPYTARAVASIAFGLPVMPVDGNIERVMTRLYRLNQPVRQIKPAIATHAQHFLEAAPGAFPGDLAQGLMDLGATICTPRNPKCAVCPLRGDCAAYQHGDAGAYPVSEPKKIKPTRYGQVFVVRNKKGEVLLVRRPGQGLLAGMLGLPTSEWTETPATLPACPHLGQVRHSFTHFNLVLDVVSGLSPLPPGVKSLWCAPEDLSSIGLPKVFLKVVPFIPL